jgi:hypothetical protein
MGEAGRWARMSPPSGLAESFARENGPGADDVAVRVLGWTHAVVVALCGPHDHRDEHRGEEEGHQQADHVGDPLASTAWRLWHWIFQSPKDGTLYL